MNKLMYQIRNLPAILRGRFLGSTTTMKTKFRSALSAKVVRADGSEHELGVISTRKVTKAGVTYLCADWKDGSTNKIANFKYLASGTGTGAESNDDTALGTEVTDNARTSATMTNPTAYTVKAVGTIEYTGNHAITELGLFSASSSGTLWDRSVFSAINVASGDSIQFSYTLTVSYEA